MVQENTVSRVHARMGLLGNPSDSYYGKTISLSLANFLAEVTLTPSSQVAFVPHLLHDGGQYTDLEELRTRITGEGYSGGIRLLKAICKKFLEACEQRQIRLPAGKNFTLSYETNIPRQAGLSGSSAIVCAALNCLLDFYGVADRFPVHERPNLVLSAEEELGITAGLQDRVVQVFGGVVFMDFEQGHMQAHGHGRYESLDPAVLPRLWLVYAAEPSDSGAVHSDIRRRWQRGDADVAAAMTTFADIAQAGRHALETGDRAALARLMDQNFDTRRRLFGDLVLGEVNLRMIQCARSVGAAAKFTGSGGAIVAFCPQGEGQEDRLRAACQKEGFVVVQVEIGEQCFQATSSLYHRNLH
ncbi:ribosomal protein S5 domain 2-like protein [Coccomyxa subellipsoidea C-169]|uniref:Ribosomal protein S5 domain 2-like protein n=1 Tax=Coccomyxa subellipsoidea (strain C-169) TaxID=574566 RepID=I0YJW4_COCSC|nr:ribosomal protein S5 domain 2-like protein [Coccomyxa subellipsoidea C-169]EIE18683.1 ribosomal protein S5 domain 2-like protein [Coccomyxa subellipsoidea C-169]|eukprot:XP_005643227.1 ribosomal protein S5 domain 2-like protein [Coccomyxa subellipsoidea C-169]